jgi:hypothetical protein
MSLGETQAAKAQIVIFDNLHASLERLGSAPTVG